MTAVCLLHAVTSDTIIDTCMFGCITDGSIVCRGGLVVHLGCGDGKLTAALRTGDAYLVHGLDVDPAEFRKVELRKLKD